ncbi:hypothetical protein R3I93_008195 [Phoxinus phoxinus]|uniref:Uncharacterized protein n=1 Tax=Phoxinus phoxinus TaxID=58324 RepID=A0AAN9H8H6_9TELE
MRLESFSGPNSRSKR